MRSPTSLNSGQVQLNSSTATQIVSARSSRAKLRLNFGSNIYIGPAGVTTSTGFILNGGSSGEIELETGDALYGIAGSGTPTVGFLETFD